MSRREVQTYQEYRYGQRGVLRPGDRFRVSGGPVYVTNDGRMLPMFERGIFTFRRYCVRGASRWLEACRAGGGGTVILWVGKSRRSPVAPNLRCRPYRIAGKLRDA